MIGALTIIGLPPLGAMWSKWYLLLGGVEAQRWSLVGVLVLSTLLNVAYLLPVPVRGFMSNDGDAQIKEAPIACLIALAITCAGCVALFFFAGPLLQFIAGAVRP